MACPFVVAFFVSINVLKHPDVSFYSVQVSQSTSKSSSSPSYTQDLKSVFISTVTWNFNPIFKRRKRMLFWIDSSAYRPEKGSACLSLQSIFKTFPKLNLLLIHVYLCVFFNITLISKERPYKLILFLTFPYQIR
jgi:hypothetical protein